MSRVGREMVEGKVEAEQYLSISTTASSKSCLDPEFLKAIPIMKTRSGMQVRGGPRPRGYTWFCWGSTRCLSRT